MEGLYFLLYIWHLSIFRLIIMKNISQRTLQYNIELVKYENPPPKSVFDLTTVHSLLIDHNIKFIELKQLIIDYNDRLTKQKVNRPNLNRSFIERLYKMLCEVTRMCQIQNQRSFLNKIYAWAFEGNQFEEEENYDESNLQMKQRPGTASTATRPYSAYTRKTRPDSAIQNKQASGTKKKTFESVITQSTMNRYPQVDFKKLKSQEKDFFLGHRTLHPEEERPKVRLKDYFRKNLDEKAGIQKDSDDEAGFDQFFEEKQEEQEKKNFQRFPEIPIQVQEPAIQPPVDEDGQKKQGQEQNIQGAEGAQGAQQGGIGDEDVNIDDIVGDEEAGILEQEEVEQIDKLRPAIKAYGRNKIKDFTRRNERKYQQGVYREFQKKNRLVQQVQEDIQIQQLMRQWAGAKNKISNEQRRRAESARIMTKPVGIVYEKKQSQQICDGLEVIDLSNPNNVVTTKTGVRPKTAFKPESERVKKQSLRDAYVTGKLDMHLKNEVKQEQNKPQVPQIRAQVSMSVGDRLTSVAPKPKKKTFQEILRQAEERVQNDAQDQISDIKQKLTMNKITMGANKIAKSLTYHENQVYEGDFTGGITGKSMLNNPFFKVAKKKKKKKKKK